MQDTHSYIKIVFMHAECHWLPDYKEGKGAERSAQANCPRPILSRRIDWLPVLECGDHAHEHAIATEHRLAAPLARRRNNTFGKLSHALYYSNC
jgi:hypothetical protein